MTTSKALILRNQDVDSVRSDSATALPAESLHQHLACVEELAHELLQIPLNGFEMDEQKAMQSAVRSHLQNVAALISVLCDIHIGGKSGVLSFSFGRHRSTLYPYVEQFLTSARKLQRQVLPNYEHIEAPDCSSEFTRESLLEALTEREKDTLTHVLSGESNKIIAYKMNITEATVKAHISSVLRKFAVPSRARLIAMFRKS